MRNTRLVILVDQLVGVAGFALLLSCSRAGPDIDPSARVVASSQMPSLREQVFPAELEHLDIRPHTLAVTASGTIVVWVRGDENHWLRSIDSTGNNISSWGRPGEGPGEIRPADLVLSGDSAVVIAGVSGEPVRVYTPAGSLIVQRSSPPIGLPASFRNGALTWWTAEHVGIGPREPRHQVHREGPMLKWCVLSPCEERLLAKDDSIVRAINAAAPPSGYGLWPGFASRGDVTVVGDGYSYRLWRIDELDGSRTSFGRQLPARMATEAQIARAESGWARLETRGFAGPSGQMVKDNYNREREFIRTHPFPHFSYLGMDFDDHGRLWVIGRRASGDMFLDVFSDTTFLGRETIDCDRALYAATVRGHWLAMICVEDKDTEKEHFRMRLFRIEEPMQDTLDVGSPGASPPS